MQAELANLVHCVESSTGAWSEAFTLRGGGPGSPALISSKDLAHVQTNM